MTKKPASLTSDLLARKGEAGPSSVDPVSRVTISPGRQSNLSGIGTNEGPSPGLYARPATERPEMYGTDEEERPSPPEPEIIYTPEDEDTGGRTRLIAGAFVGLALLGGVIVALSLNDGGSGVAPVSPDVTSVPDTAPAERAEAPSTAQATAPATAPVAEMPADTAAETATEIPAAPEAAVPGDAETASAPEEAPAPVSQAEAPAAAETSAPTSLTPPAAAPEAAKPAPEATAAAEPAKPAAAAAPASGGAYVVQIMALREEAAAKTAWAALQKKHGAILGGHALDIKKADLGDKGTFYRVRAAGFATKADAQSACSSLKSAGQDCLVKAR